MKGSVRSISEGGRSAQPAPGWLLVALSVPVMAAAFPPLDLGWLAWIAMAPALIAFSRARSAPRAFASAYIWGFAYWGWIVLWIGATVAAWCGSLVGWAAWLALAAIEAVWFGLAGAGTWWIFRRRTGVTRALAAAAWWVALEWLRSLGSLSMPWALLGYTQHRFLVVAQCADIGGVYLVGFLPAFTAAVVAGFCVDRGQAASRQRATLRQQAAGAGVAAALVLAACAYGVARIDQREPTASVTALLVQPNLSTHRAMVRDADLGDRLHRLAGRAPRGSVEVALWPESVTDDDVTAPCRDHDTFTAIAREMRAYQFVGTACDDDAGRSYTSVALFAPDGAVVGRYDKRHLVPFGEWTPFRAGLGSLDRVFHFVRDTTAGRSAAPLRAGPARVGMLICYESAFPGLARRNVQEGANVLANLTNDSWAGDSGNIPQHLAMTRFRAIETRRAIMVSALTGATAVVSPSGRLRSLPAWREGTMVARVALASGFTWYTRFGDWFAILCLVGSMLAVLPLRAGRGARGG